MGDQVVTLREVVSEIRDKATKQRLQVLPYDLQFKDPHAEDLKHVSDFAKKTGDYSSLSATDLKVLALTFRLEKEAHNGAVDHLRAEPVAAKPTVSYYTPGGGQGQGQQQGSSSSNSAVSTNLPGFYMPKDGEDEEEDFDEVSSDDGGNDDESGEENEVSLAHSDIDMERTAISQKFSAVARAEDGNFGAEAFSSFHFWRDPLPDIELAPVAAPVPTPKNQLSSDSLSGLNSYFSSRSYALGHTPSAMDLAMAGKLSECHIDSQRLPHLFRYLKHAQSFSSEIETSGISELQLDSAARLFITMGEVSLAR